MIVMRDVVMQSLMDELHLGIRLQLTRFEFFLLIISGVMLTAAGNIINDYFDRRVDMVNRPNEVIIGKHIKRRVAIILHQLLNATALLCAVYVSYQTGYWWPLLIPVLISMILWWYSPYLKKRVLIGNLAVSLCTAAVPLWAVIYEINELREHCSDMMFDPDAFFQRVWMVTGVVVGFVFILSMAREVVKDIEDIPGDTNGNYTTIPIVYGEKVARRYALGWMLVFFIGIGWLVYDQNLYATIQQSAMLIITILIPFLVSVYLLSTANSSRSYHQAGIALKWLMVGGLLALVLLSYMH